MTPSTLICLFGMTALGVFAGYVVGHEHGKDEEREALRSLQAEEAERLELLGPSVDTVEHTAKVLEFRAESLDDKLRRLGREH